MTFSPSCAINNLAPNKKRRHARRFFVIFENNTLQNEVSFALLPVLLYAVAPREGVAEDGERGGQKGEKHKEHRKSREQRDRCPP